MIRRHYNLFWSLKNSL